MEPTYGDQPTIIFDVMPIGEQWEVRGSDGQTLCTMLTDKAVIDYATIAAMDNRPAKVGLLTANGKVVQEWDYPA